MPAQQSRTLMPKSHRASATCFRTINLPLLVFKNGQNRNRPFPANRFQQIGQFQTGKIRTPQRKGPKLPAANSPSRASLGQTGSFYRLGRLGTGAPKFAGLSRTANNQPRRLIDRPTDDGSVYPACRRPALFVDAPDRRDRGEFRTTLHCRAALRRHLRARS